MKKALIRSLYGIFIVIWISSIVNCKIEPEEEILTNQPEIPVTITEEVMNDFIVKPIIQHDAYFVQGKRVSGILGGAKSPEDITPIKFFVEINGDTFPAVPASFFTINGIPYFEMKQAFAASVEGEEPEIITKWCKQEQGKIIYLDTKPEEPELSRIADVDGNYEFSIGDYSGQAISIADRYKNVTKEEAAENNDLVEGERVFDYQEKMMFIDNFIVISGGALLSVQEGRGSSRPEGLLFWPDGKSNMDKWKEQGRLWK